jgi:hypothetical protein
MTTLRYDDVENQYQPDSPEEQFIDPELELIHPQAKSQHSSQAPKLPNPASDINALAKRRRADEASRGDCPPAKKPRLLERRVESRYGNSESISKHQSYIFHVPHPSGDNTHASNDPEQLWHVLFVCGERFIGGGRQLRIRWQDCWVQQQQLHHWKLGEGGQPNADTAQVIFYPDRACACTGKSYVRYP